MPANADTTVYFGAVAARKWKVAGQEQVLTTPHPAVKLLNGTTPAAATTLHRDGLASVRAITSAAGVKVESALYKPFGEQSEWVLPGNTAPETKGWIGTRFDADAGLQYLNARYYDPDLSLFLQPDWFEVTKPGVGTNRFSYSFNDPVNRFDPNGNYSIGNGKSEENPSKEANEWLDRQLRNLKAAWENKTEALGGIVRGTVQDLAFGVENVPGSPLLGPVGSMAGAAQGVLDSCKGSSGCNDYVYGEMTPAEQGGYLVGGLVTGAAGLARAGAKATVKVVDNATGVQLNKLKGDAFRDYIADLIRQEGRTVRTEVLVDTPFGARIQDIEVSLGDRVLGYVETKYGNSRYTPSQRAKDFYISVVKGLSTVVVRGP